MHGVFLGFDFGYTRIGVAVGQQITIQAQPLQTVQANQGIPNWPIIDKILQQWSPEELIVGLPTKTDGSAQYTTKAAKKFSIQLQQRYTIPVNLVDERFTTVAAREIVFNTGGYRSLKKKSIDSIAACIILEHWMREKFA